MTSDHAALFAAQREGVALCTLVGIEGSFSRRLGAQLAVGPDGPLAGSLSDGCLEAQLARDAADAAIDGPVVRRYGAGSPLIDFRLPCGSGLDILIDPAPDRQAICSVIAELDARRPAELELPAAVDMPVGLLRSRSYIPPWRLFLFGEGPEADALERQAHAFGLNVMAFRKQGEGGGSLALGHRPDATLADEWSAVVLLFHDHAWEAALLEWALAGSAFYIGAQGGREARERRAADLAGRGLDATRVRSPVGLIHHARDPDVLALSVLADVVAEYEARHPHG